jgi:DNA (cytosine-5)-methyltransferase 1
MKKEIIFESVGELFCGPGGGALGASMSSFINDTKKVYIKHKWATDIDPDSCDTFKKNITSFESKKFNTNSDIDVINADLNSLEIDLHSNDQFPYVDGLIFGFPCNDFSNVGKSKGLDGKYGPLYKHGIKFLQRKDKPKWFIAENVDGLSSNNGGKVLQQIISEMESCGYRVSCDKYMFEEYDVPQNRHRIIMVGISEDLNKTYKKPPTSNRKITAGDALSGISENAKNQEITRQSKNVVDRLNFIKPGQNAWNADIPEHLKLNVKSTKLSNIYRRLRSEAPSYTVTGSGGGGTHMYHWKEPRALTNRERARLQTFPDWFEFIGKKESVRKQIGMAIPPVGMKFICNSLLELLHK